MGPFEKEKKQIINILEESEIQEDNLSKVQLEESNVIKIGINKDNIEANPMSVQNLLEDSSDSLSLSIDLANKKKERLEVKESEKEGLLEGKKTQTVKFIADENTSQSIDNALSYFNKDEKKRSKEFTELKKILEDNNAHNIVKCIQNGKFEYNKDNYEAVVKIYQAASAYATKHMGGYSLYGSLESDYALAIMRAFERPIFGLTMGKKNFVSLITPDSLPPKDKRIDSFENGKRLVKYLMKYFAQVDRDLISTDDEKITRKWNAIALSEKDLQYYLYVSLKEGTSGKANLESINGEVLFFSKMYTTLKAQVMLRNKALKDGFIDSSKEKFSDKLRESARKDMGYKTRESDKKKQSKEQTDEQLSKEQLEGLKQIDTWVIRNFKNAGYLAIFGSKFATDRSDVVAKLMSMNKRKRLYVYYLVESRDRVNPQMDNFMYAQANYAPNIAKFKDHMVASKLKFYKRFGGDYIYWNKLTQAMGIADEVDPLFEIAEKAIKNLGKNSRSNPVLRQVAIHDTLEEFLNDKVKGYEEKKEEYEQKMGEHRETYSGKNEAKEVIKDASGKGSKFGATAGAANGAVQLITGQSSAEAITSGIALSPASGIMAGAALAGSIFSFMNFVNGIDTLGRCELTSTLLEGSSQLLKAGKSATSVAITAGAIGKTAATTTMAIGGVAIAGIETGVAIAKGCAWARDSKHRRLGAKLAREKAEQERNSNKALSAKEIENAKYREGMRKLNRVLSKKQGIEVGGAIAVAAVSATAAGLVFATIITGGAAALITLGAVGVGMLFKHFSGKKSKAMRNTLFDSYFDTEKNVDLAMEDYLKNHPNADVDVNGKKYKALREQMTIQVRNRISAELGFASYEHATRAVASQYADYLLSNAHENGPDSTMCIAMIRGLGLKYNYVADNDKKSVPKQSDIIKKLCG